MTCVGSAIGHLKLKRNLLKIKLQICSDFSKLSLNRTKRQSDLNSFNEINSIILKIKIPKRMLVIECGISSCVKLCSRMMITCSGVLIHTMYSARFAHKHPEPSDV